jgi:hypothetical protein
VSQLETALAVPNITAVQRSRFQARLDEVREALFADRKHRPPPQQQQPKEPQRSVQELTGTILR